MPSPADDPALIQHIFRWDLDKTYLHTDFDSWIDLVRTAVETPERKRTVPGAAALIREAHAAEALGLPLLGQIARGEPIKLVDGGTQRRSFTYVDDGIDALLKIIANEQGVTSGKI